MYNEIFLQTATSFCLLLTTVTTGLQDRVERRYEEREREREKSGKGTNRQRKERIISPHI